MAKECRAKVPATCRTHGTGAAISIINDKLNGSKNISPNDRFNMHEMLNRAENPTPDPERKAFGLTVEYEDGSTDVFLGDSTDPYRRSDYGFTSVSTYDTIQGINYDPSDATNSDYVSTGVLKTSDYQNEFNDAQGEHLLLSSGDSGAGASDYKVKKITVI